MKKLVAYFLFAGALAFGISTMSVAQEGENTANDSTVQDDTAAVDSAASGDSTASGDSSQAAEVATEAATTDETGSAAGGEEEEGERAFHQVVKKYFIDGDWRFMMLPLACLILGLAIALERIITLNLATTNTKKLLAKVEDALASGGVDAAKEVTKDTRGPVASIFTQGLMREHEGIEVVEKSVIAYGSVEMGRLERGLVWISLFISLAPMLGFMGTVIGMIGAFDAIAAAGDISPQIVANGIKVALLTTVAGLVVAVILQLFYNYIVSKIDSLVNQMEDASISLVDLLVAHNMKSNS